MKHFLLILVVLAISSCNTKVKQDEVSEFKTNDTIQQNEIVFSIPNEIRVTKTYFFSNPLTQDTFILTIGSGLVDKSKSKLEIKTIENQVLYSQIFSSYYFIRWIYEPDTIPTNQGQEVFDKYLAEYRKSLTLERYEAFFQKNVEHFFDDMNISTEQMKEFEAVDTDLPKYDFYKEVLADTTIKLYDITYFDSDEGGCVIGYSKQQQKVVTLLDHD